MVYYVALPFTHIEGGLAKGAMILLRVKLAIRVCLDYT
jgi:hypothetical protein